MVGFAGVILVITLVGSGHSSSTISGALSGTRLGAISTKLFTCGLTLIDEPAGRELLSMVIPALGFSALGLLSGSHSLTSVIPFSCFIVSNVCLLSSAV